MLSNHYHLVLTDPRGVLPAFQQYLDSLLARSFNALHGRWESFWAPGSFSAVTLSTADDVLDKMAYVLANPVTAGLVRHGSEWPGLWTSPDAIGGSPLHAKRPKGFFRENGPMPPSATLRVVPPPGTESIDELRRRLAAELRRREEQAHRELTAEGRGFLGVQKVLAQRPSAQPFRGEPRRGLNPRVACHDKWKRIEAIGRLKKFLEAYRDAWRMFTDGVRDVVFPPGTWLMRVLHGARCAAAA